MNIQYVYMYFCIFAGRICEKFRGRERQWAYVFFENISHVTKSIIIENHNCLKKLNLDYDIKSI